MKKVIPIIIVIAFIALGIGIYFGWQKAKPFLNLVPASTPSAEELLTQKMKISSDKEVFDYWTKTSATSTEIFYIALDGKIFKAETNEEISGQIIANLQQVKSSNDGSKILIKYGGIYSPLTFTIFDLQTKVWQLLEETITAADFSPTEQKIIYLSTVKSGYSNLTIKDLSVKSNQKTTIVMPLYQKDFDILWIDKDLVLLVSKPSSQIEGEIWQVDLESKTLKLFSSGNGLMLIWQKNKYQGIKTIASQKKLTMSLVDKNSEGKTFNFSTFPDKCSLSDFPRLYYAVPVSQSASVQSLTLPDDYLKKAVYFNDVIYKLDTSSFTSTPEIILSSTNEAPVDVSKPAKIGGSLFFINRYDNFLYKIAL